MKQRKEQASYCAGHDRPGWENPGPGRMGRSCCRGWGFYGSPHKFTTAWKYRGANRESLQAQLDALRSELDRIERQLAQIDAKKK